MKKLLLLPALFVAGSLLAQPAIPTYITPKKYDQLKTAGQLDAHAHYLFVSPFRQVHTSQPVSRYSGPQQTQSTTCNCMIPLDTTFSVVPFQNAVAPDYRNDDFSTTAISLPFSFNFYGTTYNSLYINNNGNISFSAPYMTFTANPFPDSTFNMIAPFWADVDTRDSGSGLVYYKITPTHMIVKWDNVGYFANHSNLLNTFQLIITDGLDTILPAGSNVSFCYGDMQWTTGDASQGMGGFGGSPSTVGVNMGNGTDYFQVTQNDAAGSAFDGPYGAADGVDWLDNQEVYFNTSLMGNVPPLVLNSTICDTIDVYTGDTLRSVNQDSIMFDFQFMTPEHDQTVTATISTSAPASALSYQQTVNQANFKAYSCTFRAKDLPPGIYTVTGTATDNGVPTGQSTGTVVIHTYYDGALSIEPQNGDQHFVLYPNPAEESFVIDRSSDSPASIIVTDLVGQVCSKMPATGKRTTVNTAALKAGVYFVTVQDAKGNTQTTKLIRR